MYFAVRQNKRKRIPEDKKDTYIALGYTVLDEAGNEVSKTGEAEAKKTTTKKKTSTEAAE